MLSSAKPKWDDFWRRLAQLAPAAGDHGQRAFSGLAARYSEPHRAYHNLAHIVDCLDQFAFLRPQAHDPLAIEMALWFHDAIYDPRAKDNEERSAGMAVAVARAHSLPTAIVETVHGLIMATKKHDPSTADAQIIVDVDLSILGREPDRFEEYERQIRREYDWVPQDAFVAGRAAVLESFLGRPRIYLTEAFRQRYEQPARANIERSLKKLRNAP